MIPVKDLVNVKAVTVEKPRIEAGIASQKFNPNLVPKRCVEGDEVAWYRPGDPYTPYYLATLIGAMTIIDERHYVAGMDRLRRLTKNYLNFHMGIEEIKHIPIAIKVKDKTWHDSYINSDRKPGKRVKLYPTKGEYYWGEFDDRLAFRPVHTAVNVISSKIISHYYHLGEYTFVFLSANNNMTPVNVTELLLNTGVWPVGLRRLLLPRKAVTASINDYYPLLKQFRRKKITNVQDHITVKPKDYVGKKEVEVEAEKPTVKEIEKPTLEELIERLEDEEMLKQFG